MTCVYSIDLSEVQSVDRGEFYASDGVTQRRREVNLEIVHLSTSLPSSNSHTIHQTKRFYEVEAEQYLKPMRCMNTVQSNNHLILEVGNRSVDATIDTVSLRLYFGFMW